MIAYELHWKCSGTALELPGELAGFAVD